MLNSYYNYHNYFMHLKVFFNTFLHHEKTLKTHLNFIELKSLGFTEERTFPQPNLKHFGKALRK